VQHCFLFEILKQLCLTTVLFLLQQTAELMWWSFLLTLNRFESLLSLKSNIESLRYIIKNKKKFSIQGTCETSAHC